MALERVDRLGNRLRRAEVAQPPAGHRVGLAETVDRDRQIVRFGGERADGDVLRVVVNELLVNLVAEDEDFLLDGDVGDGFQFLARVHRAGRIARAC